MFPSQITFFRRASAFRKGPKIQRSNFFCKSSDSVFSLSSTSSTTAISGRWLSILIPRICWPAPTARRIHFLTRPSGVVNSDIHKESVSDSRSEEHTSELQSLMRISYAVFCLKKKKTSATSNTNHIDKQTEKKTIYTE